MKNTPDQIIELQVTGIQCHQVYKPPYDYRLNEQSLDEFQNFLACFRWDRTLRFTLKRQFSAVLKDQQGKSISKLNAHEILNKPGITYLKMFSCKELQPISHYINTDNLGINRTLESYLDNKYNCVDETNGEIKPCRYSFLVTPNTPAFYAYYKEKRRHFEHYDISCVRPIDVTQNVIVNPNDLNDQDKVPQELKDFLTMRRVVMPATPEYINLLFGPQHS